MNPDQPTIGNNIMGLEWDWMISYVDKLVLIELLLIQTTANSV